MFTIAAGLLPFKRGARMCQAVGTSFTSHGPIPGAHCGEWLDFQTNLYRFSIVIACTVGSFGTITEWIRTRRKQ
jgi:hypothetical protein